MLEKIFKLKQNNTTVKTEILAGLTTFMTMAYIIALNPNLLTGFGAEGTKALWNGVFLATCIASAVGMFVMAFLANKPFALAPGMGLNSFFAVVVANIVSITGLSYVDSFQAALCIILIEGILFFILSIFNIRDKIVDAIPYGVRMGISPAIGLMLLNIGFGSNAGVYSKDGGPFYVMKDFFGALTPGLAKTNMTDGYSSMVLTVVTMFIGLFVIIILAHKGVTVACVVGGFPSSQTFIEIKTAETALAVHDGADECDCVLNVGAFLSGDYETCADEIEEIKAACADKPLKVILETGALKSAINIKRAAILAMYAGADFIKTSTGKIEVAATLEAAYVMCTAIKEYYDLTGTFIGFKAAGGIKTTAEAIDFYTVVREILGEDYIKQGLFRIGTSRLANLLVSDILGEDAKPF